MTVPDSTLTPAETTDPNTAEEVVVNSVSPTSYTVQWQAGANNGEKINMFAITYYEVKWTGGGRRHGRFVRVRF